MRELLGTGRNVFYFTWEERTHLSYIPEYKSWAALSPESTLILCWMQITNTAQTPQIEKENMGTHRFPLHSGEFTYICLAKKIPYNGLWNEVLNSMNSLISMILVLSYQNDYRSRRVTEICKGRAFCSDRTGIHKFAQGISNSSYHIQSFPYFSLTRNSALVPYYSFLSWVFVLCLCFISYSHFRFPGTVHGLAGPQNFFESRWKIPMTSASFHLNSDPDFSLDLDVKIPFLY